MSQQTEAERELAELLVESLNLEGVEPASIDPEAALFNHGLGLDSIDALELVLGLKKKYGIVIEAGDEKTRPMLRSIASLAELVTQQRTQ